MTSRFVADLHVHTLLSPCAAVEMTPRNIVWHAEKYGIDIVAITDHNACDNVIAALDAAKGTNVKVIPGMEVETREEVHLVVLFEKMRQLKEWDDFARERHSGRLNDEQRFGAQFVVDAEDELVRVKTELLLAPLNASVAEVTERVNAIGGICIASHVDRPMYSIISQLGFIPPDVSLAAVEVSRRLKLADAVKTIPVIKGNTVITSSDAHYIDDLISGPKTVFELEEATLSEIALALAAQKSRKVVV
jgi:PHP family Zn ribbon phosphoesterase